MAEHFFIIGGQRCGTTYLYEMLDSHPQIEMARPLRPEPKFFLREDLTGLRYQDYLAKHFQSDCTAQLLGEKSTSYIEHERAAQAIAKWLPQAKILISVREPIARAISNYHFSVENGLENLSLEAALQSESQRLRSGNQTGLSVSPFAYRRRGHYMRYLEVWQKYFPAEAIQVLVYEEFTGQLEELQKLYAWLGVADDWVPEDVDQPQNPSRKQGDTTLSARMLQELQQEFAPSNAALEAFLNRRIPDWHSSRG